MSEIRHVAPIKRTFASVDEAQATDKSVFSAPSEAPVGEYFPELVKKFYFRPLTGTGKTAMRVNGCSNQQLESIRQGVQGHIDGGTERERLALEKANDRRLV